MRLIKSIDLSIKEINEEIVLTLHEAKLNEWRSKPLARPESYLDRMLQVVKKLPVSFECNPDEIKAAVNSLKLSEASRFETVRVINEVRKWKSLPTIENPRPERPDEVTYIPVASFLLRLESIKEEHHRLYLGALYATGARYGELPMVKVVDDWVFIAQQLRNDGRKWRTKNGRQRHAAILPELKEFIMAYKALPWPKQASLRIDEYDRLYGACTRSYGVSLHTLRHSYAIECAKRGKSVEQIASYIGDTIEVAKKHYLGYIKPSNSPWP